MIVLETERLLFRHHRECDFESFREMESDPEYRWPQRVHPPAELERSFREGWLPPKAMGLLATVHKADGRYIGRCGLYPNRDDDDEVIAGEARLGYYLARPYWGQGLATEAARAFVAYGFGELGLRRIVAGVNARNAASIRVIEKVGLVWVRSGEDQSGAWHDYELRNPGWARQQWPREE